MSATADPAPPIPQRPRPRAGSLEAKLLDLFGSVAFMVAATGDLYCAQIITSQAEDVARAWIKLANENAQVKKLLSRLVEGSAWGEAIVTTLVMALPIAAHHGLVPAGMAMPFGFVPPSEEVQDEAAGEYESPITPTPPRPENESPITPPAGRPVKGNPPGSEAQGPPRDSDSEVA